MAAKPITYKTSVEWTGGHQGTIHSPKKEDVTVTCPPPFCNLDDLWSPEDFFVGSVEMCLMMTFLWFADRAELPIVSYKSHAIGTVEYIDGKAQFTKVEIFPSLEVSDDRIARKTKTLLRGAERNCLVSASIKTQVLVTAEIHVAQKENL